MLAAAIAFSTLASVAEVNVAVAINADTTSTIRVIQPAALEALTGFNSAAGAQAPAEEEQTVAEENGDGAVTRVAGYRVQVFSDNNQRTAKGEARSKERQIREAYPDYETYIVYNSPFWRLKVGDFRTQHEAEAAADDIKSRFPSFAREVRIVRDRVNIRR